jgi:hypothetical protein
MMRTRRKSRQMGEQSYERDDADDCLSDRC